MKLGDNMAPIEACNVWNDVCPRKTRPPKIGDIPRHVAVDEESPGSSTTRSDVQAHEAAAAAAASTTSTTRSMLERAAIGRGKPAASSGRGAFPSPLETLAKPPTAPPSIRRLERVARRPDELARGAETRKRSSDCDSARVVNGPEIADKKILSSPARVENISTSLNKTAEKISTTPRVETVSTTSTAEKNIFSSPARAENISTSLNKTAEKISTTPRVETVSTTSTAEKNIFSSPARAENISTTLNKIAEKISTTPRRVETVSTTSTAEKNILTCSARAENISTTLNKIAEKISTTPRRVETVSTTSTAEKNIFSCSARETKHQLLHEDENHAEIIQVRKDSALYVDAEPRDCNSVAPTTAGGRLAAAAAAATTGIVDQRADDASNSRLVRPRARRESSGYFSNLGTFDEDRWSAGSSVGATDPAASQHQDRSRSTVTKSRISMGVGQQLANRATGLVCPAASEETIAASSTEGDDVNAVKRVEMPNIDDVNAVKRVEMPNIDERMSLDRSSGGESDRRPEETSSDQSGEIPLARNNDEIREALSRISLENSSSESREAKSQGDDSAAPPRRTGESDRRPEETSSRISLENSSFESREAKSQGDDSAAPPRRTGESDRRPEETSSHQSGETLARNNDEIREALSRISLENSSSESREAKSQGDESAAPPRRTAGESSRDVDVTGDTRGGNKSGSADLLLACQQRSTSCCRAAERRRGRTVVHRYSSPNMTNAELTRIAERPRGESHVASSEESPRVDAATDSVVSIVGPTEDFEDDDEEEADDGDDDDDDDDDQVVAANLETNAGSSCDNEADARKLLPRSIKVYQLLSTQSEDRGDGDTRLYDRRISLQIPQRDDNEATTRGNATQQPPRISTPTVAEHVEEKKLVHADSVPILKIPSSDTTTVDNELRLCVGGRTPGSGGPSGPVIPGIRPIYPYCPYSPYASPQGSPRTNRRRPLRESRRVSIDSRQGALQLNQYKLLNNIGQGSFGIVKLAYNEEDETHYAMKILSKKKLMKKAGIFGRIAPGRKGVANPLAKVYREIALLKKLDHPNVVKLVEVLDDPDEDNLYLVFELVQRGEVLQLPTEKPLDEETARIHFRDVVMGVEYLHYQRIVHRDIKPSNLLVDSEGRVKVADLGVSAELRAAGELLSGSAGTPAFAAPETTTPGAQYSGTLCDVWSMGVTLYSLVTGKVPWDGAGSIIGVQSAVRTEPLRFPESPCLSDDLRHLVSRMLAKDPARRITLAEIKEHPWLTRNGEEPLPNEADNCRLPVTVTDEEVARVVTRVPKLDTLILIKTMLKQHSFQNPFLPRRTVRSGCTPGDPGTSGSTLKQQVSSDTTDSSTELLPTVETLKSKTEQFHKAGRSNSAPDSYEWQTNGRQISSDSLLPPVTESSSQEQQAEVEKR